ncbi:sugar kinase [Staphylococcus muscae]|uniref:2-dehydro-3-deoxygluconokinase n=1 Tax=Staphylococcus muscae TaxID=1294 RepID=A0A240BTV6_9STAP|nr:sugar kinase [Staphylococcus muscae]AVQ34593.1 sugar kinase [Staphylococcus muscae]PNZ03495.1 sugar kinase [Staphylococcus muscae]GGA85655.1 2-dehydro-3-deoxygluconokinase [Staphylococcus muscae]SNV99135.1 2-dehydro-3-deoxygluconokinase [Staphylococcus muscae]
MKLLTFGEILMRLSSPQHEQFSQVKQLEVHYGGAEMNVAIGLSGFGIQTSIVSALPDHVLGDCVIQTLEQHRVDTSHILRHPGRLGVYYLERGFGLRAPKIIYDRKDSVFTKISANDFEIPSYLADYDWFHITGITAGLDKKLLLYMIEVAKQAKALGLTVSCDLNYRALLWDFDTARIEMSELLPYVDVLFGYEPVALPDETRNNKSDKKDGLSRDEDIEVLQPILQEIHEKYEIPYIAFTQRKIFDTKRNRLQGFLSSPQEIVQTHKVDIDILDRVGTGDAFSVGIIYGFMNKWPLQEIVDFGLKNMCYKHTVSGDYSYTSKKQIDELTANGHDIKR